MKLHEGSFTAESVNAIKAEMERHESDLKATSAEVFAQLKADIRAELCREAGLIEQRIRAECKAELDSLRQSLESHIEATPERKGLWERLTS